MIATVKDALNALRELGAVEDLQAAARAGLAPSTRPAVNSHIHLPPNFSAFDTVRQAVELAGRQGVRVLGVSNYYNHEVYAPFVAECFQRGIFPLFGLEIIALVDELVQGGIKINDPGNPGKIYICGKGITRFDALSPEAERLMATIRRNDAERMALMTRRMAQLFAERGVGVELDDSAIIDAIVRRHGSPRHTVYLQERHIAQAFQEALFAKVPPGQRSEALQRLLGAPSKAPDDAVKVQNDIRSHLMKAGKPAFVPETFITLPEARRLILELGGIPCYPTLADGASPICQYEDPVESLIESIRGMGVHMAEFIPIRNAPDVLAHYVKAMRRAGLVVTAGTEHNTLDLLPIEPTCLNATPIPEDVKAIFWEGACVVAAHQFLNLHGQCGFVDSAGRPNPAYPDPESRIAAFRTLGAAVLHRYFAQARGGPQ